MAKAPDLSDYIDVSARIAEFRDKYPTSSLQSECQFLEIDGRWTAVVKAYAYRTPDDIRPGTGLAYEFIPGTTPYTKNSELQNAETAAWGRAIIAVGAADAKKIASYEEVRNRVADQAEERPPNAEGREALRALCVEKGWNVGFIAELYEGRYGKPPRVAANEDLLAFVNIASQGLVVTVAGQTVEQALEHAPA